MRFAGLTSKELSTKCSTQEAVIQLKSLCKPYSNTSLIWLMEVEIVEGKYS